MADQSIFDDASARKFLETLRKKCKQVEGAQDEFAVMLDPVVFRDIVQHFENEEGSKGKWKAWSKAYAEHMQEIGRGGNQILQYSGRLKQSFVPRNFRQEKAGILWFNPAKTESGFPYAYAHDEGGPQLPKRDFMWLSKEAMSTIEKITLDFILGD